MRQHANQLHPTPTSTTRAPRLAVALAATALLAAGCGSSGDTESGQATTATTGGAEAPVEATFTPLLLQPGGTVEPVRGTDDRYHLVWEVPLQNATSLDLTVTELEVLGDGTEIVTLDGEQSGQVVQVVGSTEPSDTIGTAQWAFAHLTTSFASLDDVPDEVTIDVTVTADPLPEPITVSGGATEVLKDAVVPVLTSPLAAGSGYIVGDGCCDSRWHIRAGLPVNGGYHFAQRFAIDWEQIDEEGRFSNGDLSDPASYTIYGTDVLSVADGTVITAVDGYENQVPGAFPTGLPLAESDGNHVVLDIGDGLFVLFAHLQPGSVMVSPGDQVSAGQLLGRVGNTGNTLVPHMHLHVTDGPSPLTSNGRPYVLDAFTVAGQAESSEAFAEVEVNGQPLATVPSDDDGEHTDALPLDLQLITFP